MRALFSIGLVASLAGAAHAQGFNTNGGMATPGLQNSGPKFTASPVSHGAAPGAAVAPASPQMAPTTGVGDMGTNPTRYFNQGAYPVSPTR